MSVFSVGRDATDDEFGSDDLDLMAVSMAIDPVTGFSWRQQLVTTCNWSMRDASDSRRWVWN